MKTPIKILILFTAVIIAVGGVLLYMKIIMEPPLDLGNKNQYTEYLGSLTKEVKNADADKMESHFQKVTDITKRFSKENLLSEEQGNKSYSEFILVYAPKFSSWSLNRFRQPAWDADQLSWISSRIDYLNNLKNSSNNPLIAKDAPDTAKEFETIKSTIAKYNEAKRLGTSGFSSLSDSRRKIARAKELAADEYLRNNSSLMASLNSLPSKLEAGHYASLKRQVASMANFRNYSRSSYNALSDKVLSSINEYRNNASSVYGHVSDVNSLMNQAANHQSNADDYFDRKEYEDQYQNELI